jgi:hypothetical protein
MPIVVDFRRLVLKTTRPPEIHMYWTRCAADAEQSIQYVLSPVEIGAHDDERERTRDGWTAMSMSGD